MADKKVYTKAENYAVGSETIYRKEVQKKSAEIFKLLRKRSLIKLKCRSIFRFENLKFNCNKQMLKKYWHSLETDSRKAWKILQCFV